MNRVSILFDRYQATEFKAKTNQSRNNDYDILTALLRILNTVETEDSHHSSKGDSLPCLQLFLLLILKTGSEQRTIHSKLYKQICYFPPLDSVIAVYSAYG